ncbi:protein FAM167A-like [Gigantopelta aegis]|uniref:protein FAM167A-like n=1 Tax=Gigantopelta aegis TaxID=1735272 RepID=UPI001B8898BA|nr:protein FAM167A-like [Gigantopelta aegis]XP_041361153.1 protein FAM167A-like [Gigantopelta aegis]
MGVAKEINKSTLAIRTNEMGGRRKSSYLDPGTQHLPIISEDANDVIPEIVEQPSRRISKIDDSDLSQVKATTARLNLKTRRASVVAWKAQYVDKPSLAFISVEATETTDDRLTPERKQRINQALDWIKNELIELRRQDQSLARQLLGIRRDISQLKLSRSCEKHQDMLDEAQWEMEEFQELNRFLDTPCYGCLSPDPLKHIGVTKMNISTRRFSTC